MNERANEGRGAMPPLTMDDGALRAWLDHDPVLDDAAREQIAAALAEQPALAARLAALRADAAAVDDAFAGFALPEPDADQMQRAYRRVQTRLTTERHSGFLGSIKERLTAMTDYRDHRTARMRRYALAGGIGVVALAFLLVFAPVGSVVSAALDKFRYQPTNFAVVTVNTSNFPIQGGAPGSKPGTAVKPATGSKPAGSPTAQDQQKTMDALAKYVTVTSSIGQGKLPGTEVKTPADVLKATGRAVTAPPASALPPAIAATAPRYYVSDHQTADATLHLNEIRPTLTAMGMASLVPATGDSATIHVDAPAAAIVSYGFDPTAQGAAAQSQKGIAIIAMGTPTIEINGLDVPGIIAVLGTLPNVPPELVAQLKSADLAHTLIIPVTNDQVVTHGAVNAGSTTISQKDGSMSVTLWTTTENGASTLHAVVGSYDAKTVEQVAKAVK